MKRRCRRVVGFKGKDIGLGEEEPLAARAAALIGRLPVEINQAIMRAGGMGGQKGALERAHSAASPARVRRAL